MTPEQKKLDKPVVVNTEVKPNVFQRIHAVMCEIETIKKNGFNNFQKYEYATEADYVHALRPLFKAHGLVLIPQVTRTEIREGTGKDKDSFLTTLDVAFNLVNIDNPADTTVVKVVGQGSDKGDKGVYKAMTGAKKYFASLTFLVATGDDPENDGGAKVTESTRRPANKAAPKPATHSGDDF